MIYVDYELPPALLHSYNNLRDSIPHEYRYLGLPILLSAKPIAEKLNITKIITKYLFDPGYSTKAVENLNKNEITILGAIGAFYYTTNTPIHQWERFKGSQKPTFRMARKMEYNFIFCSQPKLEK